jgi:hypothetical protein
MRGGHAVARAVNAVVKLYPLEPGAVTITEYEITMDGNTVGWVRKREDASMFVSARPGVEWVLRKQRITLEHAVQLGLLKFMAKYVHHGVRSGDPVVHQGVQA